MTEERWATPRQWAVILTLLVVNVALLTILGVLAS